MTANDPLLQAFQLKHLQLRNRFLSTAHEPAYTEDGMPKARYRLYHAEKARGGIALTMLATLSTAQRAKFVALMRERRAAWRRGQTGARTP